MPLVFNTVYYFCFVYIVRYFKTNLGVDSFLHLSLVCRFVFFLSLQLIPGLVFLFFCWFPYFLSGIFLSLRKKKGKEKEEEEESPSKSTEGEVSGGILLYMMGQVIQSRKSKVYEGILVNMEWIVIIQIVLSLSKIVLKTSL